MLKEAIEKIVSLATPETYAIGGDTYTTNRNMMRIEPHIPRPGKASFCSLDGIVQVLCTEVNRLTLPVFVSVQKHDYVQVFTTYRPDNMQRDFIYDAVPTLPASVSEWMGHDDAMIALRARFIETADTNYIIDLLSSISDESSVKTTDNGLTQTVNVRQGIGLQEKAVIKPRVILRPFRTFMEVEQPASEFLLRMKPGDPDRGREAQIGLIEADGGAWKLAAKHNIAEYFRDKLADLIAYNSVIVTE